MVIDELLLLTQSRIGKKTAMQKRFSLICAHFQSKINFQIIKVAGTNGKGSTSAMLSACLHAEGKNVGLFTSPHLLHVRERFIVNEVEIADNELDVIALEIKNWLDKFLEIHGMAFMPSFFEILILVAIEFFNRKKVEIAIFEAGVGGSNDATSLLPNILALITSIGLDHSAQLGNTVESVALDKAGIAGSNSTLIVQNSIPSHLKNIIKHHVELQNIEFQISKNYIQTFETSLTATFASVIINEEKLELHPSLKGNYQKDNLNLVIAAWEFLLKKGIVQHVKSLQAVSDTIWNVRFEVMNNNSIWIIDAAHNEPAIQVLIESLNQVSDKRERVLLLGISKEKDYKKILKLASKISDKVYLTDDFYKALSIQELEIEVSKLELNNPRNGNLSELVTILNEKKKQIIVVTGSIFMIGKAREIIKTVSSE